MPIVTKTDLNPELVLKAVIIEGNILIFKGGKVRFYHFDDTDVFEDSKTGWKSLEQILIDKPDGAIPIYKGESVTIKF